jgi:23S rRNA (adenine2503-C2)-methyltransferase
VKSAAAPPSPVDILDLSAPEFAAACRAFLAARGEAEYRTRQLADWVYRRTPDGFESMSDLPAELRRGLGESFVLHPLAARAEKLSRDGTRKHLWSTRGGDRIESVVIPDRDRVTYCISTQAGCPVKCTFCATGYGGFRGQLSAAEIVDQVLLMRRIAGRAPTNIVYMGMGEPLLNFDAVARSLEVLTSPEQVGFGARRVTVSTVGIPEKIRALGARFPQVKLALSLHAARDALRDDLIPLNRKYPLEDVMRAVSDHARSTGKKVTFEYIVLPGVNDAPEDARAVAMLASRVPSRINLIGYNPFPGGPYERPPVRRLLSFRAWLEASFHGAVTLRRSRGDDIQGACGQLSLRELRA